MDTTLTDDQKFDLTTLLGAAVALYWALYVDPLTGEKLALVLGSVIIVAGVRRYVDDQHVVQGASGLVAVSVGGAAPATVLYRTPAGDWLVGSQPLPLALGWLLVVCLGVMVGRRWLEQTVTRADHATA